MLFVQLSDMLKDRFAVWSYISDSNARVNMLLFGGINCMLNEPDTSYFFAYSNFNKSMTLPQNVIASFDSEFEKFELLNAAERDNSNIILVPTKESTNVLNFAQMLLVSSLRESDNYAVFLRMILNGRDLSYILTEAAKQCRGQLVAIDFSGKIFAHSTPAPDLLPEWKMYLKDGYCPAEFMQHCYDMLLKRTEISSRAYSYRCEDHGIYYLSSPIVINNCAHGYIFMLSWEENNSPKAHETVQLISRVAADFIRRNEPEQSSSAQLYRRLLTDILGGESRNAIAERITAGKFTIPDHMRVMLVHPFYYSDESEMLKNLSAQLGAVFFSLPPIQYRRSILMVVPDLPDEREKARKALGFLRGLAEGNRLKVGISNRFDSLQDLPQYYSQACEAIALSERLRLNSVLTFYSDVSFYSLMSHLSEGTHMRDFCHSALETLKKYDIENGTELFETARVYVKTNCNQKETAELLHTHRNTISYRKQQIQQLTNIDFLDPDELFQLNYSFRIYAYLES